MTKIIGIWSIKKQYKINCNDAYRSSKEVSVTFYTDARIELKRIIHLKLKFTANITKYCGVTTE